MAQAPSGRSDVLCRYFMCGVCREGKNCRYSHDTNATPDIVCRFYLKGQCAYGDRCRYDHVKDRKKLHGPGPENRPTTASASPKTSPQKQNRSNPASSMGRQPLSANSEPFKSNLVPLSKNGGPPANYGTLSLPKAPEDWVKAKEFVPGQFYDGAVPATYAKAVQSSENLTDYPDNGAVGDNVMFPSDIEAAAGDLNFAEKAKQLLCPFFAAQGGCPYAEECVYLHGDVCDMCGLAVLHPWDEEQREKHNKECMEQHERDMELSFAVAKSRDKSCGICMETVLEKEPPTEQRFGILENCNHCFCLTCIRKWRCAKQFEKVIVKACPECRVKSDFVTPSQLWVDSPEEKSKLIEGYKNALRQKPCRHFDQGRGECPFNDKCFYRHALPDGTIAPPVPRRPRRRHNADGDLETIERIRLWDFLEADDLQRQVMMSLEDDLTLIMMMNILAYDDDDSLSDDDTDDSDF